MKHHYQDLKIWQNSIELSYDVYKLIENFPQKYWSLADQLRRAIVSVPSNIAEWSGRWGKKEFAQFLWYARWSLWEVDTQLILAEKFQLIQKATLDTIRPRIEEIGKMISWLIHTLE